MVLNSKFVQSYSQYPVQAQAYVKFSCLVCLGSFERRKNSMHKTFKFNEKLLEDLNIYSMTQFNANSFLGY